MNEEMTIVEGMKKIKHLKSKIDRAQSILG